MKKNNVLKWLMVNLFCLTLLQVQAQEAIFYSSNCGTDETITANCPSYDEITVQVTGQGTMGANNFGLTEVFFDLSGFFGQVYLVAPNGSSFLLAENVEGNECFPQYNGTGQLQATFRRCSSSRWPTSNVDHNSNTYYPLENFETLNNGSNSANGTWKFRFCGFPDDFTVLCARLTFDNICPEISSFNVFPESCSGANDGSMHFFTNPGKCNTVLYSLDNGSWVSGIDRWGGLAAGEHTMCLGEELNSSLRGSTLPPVTCQSCMTFTVGSNDMPPTFSNIPADLIVSADASCQGSVNLVDPAVNDDCQVTIMKSTFTAPNGDIIFQDIDLTPGVSFTYNLNNGAGNYSLVFNGADSAGNTISETTTITLVDTDPPTFSSVPADMTISAGASCNAVIDLVDPTPVDNCNNITSQGASLIRPDGTYQFQNLAITPGVSFQYNLTSGLGDYIFEWTAQDGSGISTTVIATITVVDDTSPTWTSSTDIQLTGQCGVDNEATLLAQGAAQLTGTDNCASDVNIFLFSSNAGPDLCGESSQSIYTYRISDGTNVSSVQATITINMVDNTAPVLSGIPADITINCNDTYPDMPIVTAMDACNGNLTSDIIMVSSSTDEGCTLGSTHSTNLYQYSVTDVCGNQVSVDWTVTVLNDQAVELGDNVTACAGDTYTITTSGLQGTYQWSTGATTPQIVVSNSGVYGVTVTGTSGCCSIDEVEVTFENPPVATANGGSLDCSGNDVVLMANSSVAGSTYAWSGPGGYSSTDQNPSVSQAGSYTLTVTSPSGSCTATAQAEVITDNDVPDLTTQGGTVNCIDEQVTLMANSNTPSVTYAWTGPNGFSSSTQNPQVNVAGQYEVVVTAPNACVAVGTATVFVDNTAPSLSIQDAELNCTNTSVQLQADTNDPNATYAWTGPNGFTSTSSAPNVSVPGTYNLTITSDNGCTASGTSQVSQDLSVPNLIASAGSITCTTPAAQLMAESTTTGVSYAWTGPNGFSSNDASTTTTQAGNYTVVVTATNGCTATQSVEVIQDNNAPLATTNDVIIDCNTSEIALPLLVTSPGTHTYAWTGPNSYTSTDLNPVVSIAGTYNVTVTAENGCTTSLTTTVTEDMAAPSASATGGVLTCDVNSVTLMGSSTSPNVTYAWTGPNGFTSDQINANVGAPGTYTLVVTATNGCTNSAMAEVTTDGDLPNISASGGSLSCSVTEIQLMGSSTTPDVTYAWTGPNGFNSTEQNPTVSVPGTYIFEVTAPNGCQSNTELIVQQDLSQPSITAQGNTLTCADTEVQITVESEEEGLTYMWTGPNDFSANDQSPIVSNAGTYTVMVTATNGCTNSAMAEVTTDGDLPNISASGGSLSCSVTEIQLMGSSTTSDVTYAWTGPNGFNSTEQNPTVSVPGAYTLEVTAPNGCQSNTELIVQQDLSQPSITAQGNSLTCADTEVQVTVESEEEGLTYMWTGPNGFSATEQSTTVSEAGDYTVVATASNGCTSSQTVSVLQDTDLPTVSATGGTIDCDNNTVELIAQTDTENATYLWTGPEGFTSTQVNPVVGAAGTYTLLVTAPNACTATATAEVISDGDLPNISVIGADLNCLSTEVQLMGNSTTEGVTYAWTGPNDFSSTESSPTVSVPGLYILTVSADNSCQAMAQVVVNQDTTTPSLMVEGGTLTCDDSQVELVANTSQDVTYLWTGPNGFSSTAASPTVSEAGTYMLEVTASNGCTASASTEVLVDSDLPEASISQTGIDCDAGQISLSIETEASYTYQWVLDDEVISTDQAIEVSQAGTYQANIISDNGCVLSLSYTVDHNIGIAPEAEITTTNANNGDNGAASISIQAFTPANITWDNGQSGDTATGLSVGEHTVTVTDLYGCQYTYTFVIDMDTAVTDIEQLMSINIYPTISQDWIYVDAQFNTAVTAQISILDRSGKQLLSQDLDISNKIENTVDISSYVPGLYMILIQVEDQVYTQRFIKL